MKFPYIIYTYIIHLLIYIYPTQTGVYSSKSCNSQVNHAVDVVGYGTEGSVPYWRVRNSWGAWGDAGYINMKRGENGVNVNMCLISNYGHYPVVSGTSSDDDNDDNSDDSDDDKDSGK